MKKRVSGVGVDAGMIMISDRDYYSKHNGEVDEKLAKCINLKPGSYDVKWKIPKTWAGPIEGRGVVEIVSGEMVISDPCYHFEEENWDKWLDKTNFGTIYDGIIIIDSMGGDGTYTVFLEITER